jgi:hypothetical protein
MKEMFKDLIQGYKEEPRDFWEGIIFLVSLVGFILMYLWIFLPNYF